MPAATRTDGRLTVVTGASRSGKTAFALRETADARRLLAWDPEGQWCATRGTLECRTRAELVAHARGLSARLAYVAPAVNAAEFDFFCRVAWLWLQAAPGVLVVEELADVTTPGKAPDAWGVIVRRGLKYGTDIFAITQRPSESDKTVMGNAGRIVSFRMQRAQDREYMARELDTTPDRLPAVPLRYVSRTPGGELVAGELSFGRSRKAKR